ncbi:MAG TPA: hypothetical protein PK812_09365 [Beijerinckiaceae bacterium]|nr:hypothetical protein [Beijerinckiaceae bacterium]
MFVYPEDRKRLTGLAMQLLALAEQRFGPRVPGWTFLGVFFDSDGPSIVFPTRARNELEMRVTFSCRNNADLAGFQIGHEVIHMLAPDRNPPASMLEEGIATLFSLEGPSFLSPTYRTWSIHYLATHPQVHHYNEALGLVRELLAIQPDAVMALRRREPRIHAFTAEFITQTLPRVPKSLAARLMDRRKMR